MVGDNYENGYFKQVIQNGIDTLISLHRVYESRRYDKWKWNSQRTIFIH